MCQVNVDLINELRSLLTSWISTDPKEVMYETKIAFFIVIPKKRHADGDIETPDIWCFLSNQKILEIGSKLGVWDTVDSGGKPGLLLPPDVRKDGNDIHVQIASPLLDYSLPLARAISEVKSPEIKIALVGTGALGSQMFLHLMRMGYGDWVLIDKDILMPHNISRHALHSSYIGQNKASALADFANSMIENEKIADGMPLDILNKNLSNDHIEAVINSEIIVDVSTSISVSRFLAFDLQSSARRVSFFMSPTGHDLVALCEDKERDVKLDYIEMQYYRILLNNKSIFFDHIKNPDSLRYSTSCRDISSKIGQDLVALQSAISARALRSIIQNDEGSIQIWRTHPDTFQVDYYHFVLEKQVIHRFKDWSIVTDDWVIKKIYELRENKLPNETGGILIGSFDMRRKIVYVIDTIPSPPDSIEWPTLYIRGYIGLNSALNEIQSLTGNQVEYVGEWHSHPSGYGCAPSTDDRKAFSSLANEMSAEAKPAIMLIAGDNYAWYLGDI